MFAAIVMLLAQVPSVDASVDVPSVSGGAGVEASLPSASADLPGELNLMERGSGAGGENTGAVRARACREMARVWFKDNTYPHSCLGRRSAPSFVSHL